MMTDYFLYNAPKKGIQQSYTNGIMNESDLGKKRRE